jgi:hypothetical protein
MQLQESCKPTLTASGGDTNIGVSIQPKGSGTVTIDALTFPAADGSANQILQTDGSGTLEFYNAFKRYINRKSYCNGVSFSG